MVYFPAENLGRPAKMASWVLRNSRAISTEDPTTTGWDPNHMCMMGPYFCERVWIDW